MIRNNLANMLTLLSGASAIAGVLSLEGGHVALAVALLVLGQALDILDGHIARRLQVATPFGAALDWSVDVGVAVYILGWTGHWWALLPLSLLHALAIDRERRFSGRTIVVGALVAWGCCGEDHLGTSMGVDRGGVPGEAGVSRRRRAVRLPLTQGAAMAKRPPHGRGLIVYPSWVGAFPRGKESSRFANLSALTRRRFSITRVMRFVAFAF